jgi:hypothetical protein
MKNLIASLKNLFSKNQVVIIYQSFDGQDCFNANKKIALSTIENTFDVDFHATKITVLRMKSLGYTVNMLSEYSGYPKSEILFMLQF